ncbi:RNA-binding protein [Komagataella phaffii CBS 7435]|uniref:RNA binding protein n=2 Tax=Komagataella phaffii TaxID=460519 RepID=C4QVE2_KOMPG|nr:Putative RNA binding protein [Komagataella phaffii GS115]AOA60540.1 GQ67_02409T0 [Komagataella phaffii]CAH2445871.1 RNA-binding protein [Komagataella phaffii CBS 7435]AOA66145.1 GQ68_02838T0 [Komagataella phaffii GS115]CAY67215.1 Putative RNA binding protein [Komagataella phaffii GS115]CCA36324.1 RNA-binding protein [Komagataella phaffii CBS 7435]
MSFFPPQFQKTNNSQDSTGRESFDLNGQFDYPEPHNLNVESGILGRSVPQFGSVAEQDIYHGSPLDLANSMEALSLDKSGPQHFNGGFSRPINGSADSLAAPSRTVYLGNVPTDLTPKELLDHVRSGVIESCKILPEKNCAFISFLDENSAMLFHSDAILKRLTIKQNDIRIGWGNQTDLHPIVHEAVSKHNATRNVYLGHLPPDITIDEIYTDLYIYGEIEVIKVISEKRIAFVHFTSILSAVRAVQNLPLKNPKYATRKVFYGKDRCAFITKTQQHNAAQYLGLDPNLENYFLNNVDPDFISTALVQQSNAAAAIATQAGGVNNLGNRTVYLGSLQPDVTVEEVCNVVRGGILEKVRLIYEKYACFITFIDPIAAAQFFAMSSLHGLIIRNRKVKIGWGKHSGPLPNALTLAVSNGASRNLYIGGLDLDDNGEVCEGEPIKTENGPSTSKKVIECAKKLRADFEVFGEIEQINFFVEKGCAFVNFSNISNAIKAIDGIKYNKDYEGLKINFGKDRCGNIPKQFNNNHNIATNDFRRMDN